MRNGSGHMVDVNPKHVFRAAGDPHEDMLVESGIIALFTNDSLGGTQIVALRFPGEAILARGPSVALQAVVERSRVVVGRALSFPEVERHYRRNEVIAQEWLARVMRNDCTARLAHMLCELTHRTDYHRQTSGIMALPLTQQRLGQVTGQTPVNVNRAMAELERRRLIERPTAREVKFLDYPALARMSGFDPAYLEA